MATSADMIPLSDLKRRYQVHAQALQEICSSAMAQHPHMQGELQKDFEIRFAKYIGRKHAVLVDSGTTALRLAFRVFSETDESIRVCDSSVFSYVASASQPIDLGFKLRFHDVDENALWQPAEIDDDAVTLLIHMHGKMVAPNPNYSKEHIIEDAAQGLGSVRDGVKAGALGRMSCFSFAHNKTIHGYANAGIVVTDSDTDFERLKSLRFHGREGANYTRISGNHNVGSVTAGVLTYFLNRVDQDIERRESIAKFYREQFSELPLTLQSVEPGEFYWLQFRSEEVSQPALGIQLHTREL